MPPKPLENLNENSRQCVWRSQPSDCVSLLGVHYVAATLLALRMPLGWLGISMVLEYACSFHPWLDRDMERVALVDWGCSTRLHQFFRGGLNGLGAPAAGISRSTHSNSSRIRV